VDFPGCSVASKEQPIVMHPDTNGGWNKIAYDQQIPSDRNNKEGRFRNWDGLI
jgi:hypothetical protein